MEQRIGNTQQNHPHYYRAETSLIPTSNNNGRRLFVYPFRSLNSPDRQNLFYLPIPDQTLEVAFSSLNLSPAPSLLPAGLDPDFGGEGLLYNAQQRQQSSDNVSLGSLRFQNGQMGSGVGPRNPAVGPEGFVLNSPPAAAALVRDLRRYGDGQNLASGLCDFDYLDCKKQSSSSYSCPQFLSPIPCSNQNTNNISVDFGRLKNQLPHTIDFGLLNNQLPHQGNFLTLTLNDLKGRLVSLAKDQYWSRILQAKFLEPSREEIEMVISEVIDYIGDLMKNQFGNYLVQKLIAVCNEDQRTRIILSVTKTASQLISICLNPHGTRGVQKLLENVSRPQQVSLLMAAISPGAATLANDQNGHHVIQYCLKHFSAEDNMLMILQCLILPPSSKGWPKHLLDDIAANCFEVAIDRSGCCVMQACLENSRGKAREHLVSEIIANALHLAEHPYGNYVLQHMLGLKELDITADLLRQLEGNYLSISCNKYGSNVVEKCLIESAEEQSTRIIMELVRSPNASMILLDPFGNFVIQSALSVSKGLARNALLHLILVNASFMRSNIYGKKVLAWLEKKKIKLV